MKCIRKLIKSFRISVIFLSLIASLYYSFHNLYLCCFILTLSPPFLFKTPWLGDIQFVPIHDDDQANVDLSHSCILPAITHVSTYLTTQEVLVRPFNKKNINFSEEVPLAK